MTLIIISQVLLWIAVAALAVLGLAIARQVGVLYERVAPVGALTTRGGPAVGDLAPVLRITAMNGEPITIGGALAVGSSRLLMFVSPDCPICKKLIPIAQRFARSEGFEVVFASDDEPARLRDLIKAFKLETFAFVNSRELGLAFGVDKLPHAVLMGDDGLVISKGLVNSREHLESLVVAREMGLASVQDFLSQGRAGVPTR